MQITTFLGLAVAATALMSCAPSPDLGYDLGSRTEATQVTWTDGQPAVAIKCEVPGSCQERAIAVCKNAGYKVLKSENMPTTGTQREVQRPPSVVIRCGA
jgi:hypothetical protein